MNNDLVTVYDQSGRLLGVLENADEVAYVLTHNDLWTASFSLPSGDPKNALCLAHNMVRIPDGSRDTGLYRIIGMPVSEETAAGGVKTYSLEHVMATLLDDVLFGYHEIGGTGVTTAQVLAYILDHQTVKRWTLGRCDFTDQYAYKFENASLLSALLSLGSVLTEEYTWQFETNTTPWRVNLVRADASPGCGIHYMRNMVGIEKTMDATTLVTRLYMLGYGEGVNQLTIKSANGGLPYIDADTADTWGIKSSVYADTRIEDAATLMARGHALLDRLKNPYITYTATAVDLTRLTGQEWDKHMPGKLVRVMDDEHGVRFDARIVSVSKSDTRGRPDDIEITIANAPRDAADSINTLADRMGISELYSQGATNLYSQQYADNADDEHPAKMNIYVPIGCVRINQMLLTWQLSPFRAYETGAAAGGATATTTASGGASTQTSSAGGASERTSRSGGAYVQTLPVRIVDADAATTSAKSFDLASSGSMTETGANTAGLSTSGSGSGNTGTPIGTASGAAMTETGTGGPTATGSGGSGNTGSGGGGNTGTPIGTASGAAMTSTGTGGPTATGSGGSGRTGSGGSHSHTVSSHTHSFSGSQSLANGHYHEIARPGTSTVTRGVSTNATHSVSISGTTGSSSPGTGTGGSHSHTIPAHTHSIEQHSHGMNHYHTVSSHTHSVSAHTHSIDQHSHGMNHYHAVGSHSHTIPAHTHNMNHYHSVVVSLTIPAQDVTVPAHSHVFETTAHTHTVSIPEHDHTLTLEDHTHDIVYGIYEGETCESVTIKVDGNQVPANVLDGSELDIVAYLAKDEDGKITRGAWHEIEIVPSSLTRIEANIFVQSFVQSVGGGDY